MPDQLPEAHPILHFTSAYVGHALEELRPHFIESGWVGSSAINDGHGADLDIVLRVKHKGEAAFRITQLGYTLTTASSCGEEDEFITFRKGNVNLMVTDDREWFADFLNATEVCRLVKPATKVLRVAIHRVLMNREDATEALNYAEGRYG